MYDCGLVAGAAHRVVALVVNFWDALDRKPEMPVVPSEPEVVFGDPEGHVWDLSTRLLGYPPGHLQPLAHSAATMAGV